MQRIEEFNLKEATNFMERLQDKGHDCWFKTVANKDKGTLEVHIIVEDKFTIVLDENKLKEVNKNGL